MRCGHLHSSCHGTSSFERIHMVSLSLQRPVLEIFFNDMVTWSEADGGAVPSEPTDLAWYSGPTAQWLCDLGQLA